MGNSKEKEGISQIIQSIVAIGTKEKLLGKEYSKVHLLLK